MVVPPATPAAARLFRLLGHHPGPDVFTPAAASLAGTPLDEAAPLLAELTNANLLTDHVPGRYTRHDLLRAYATELTDPDDARAALHRLLDHYAHTAHAASMLLTPHRTPLDLGPPSPGAHVGTLESVDAAVAWFAVERAALVAAVGAAAANGFPRQTGQLAWAATAYFARQGHGHAWVATQQAALRAAEQTGDLPRQAEAHRALLRAYGRLGREQEAGEHFERALELFTRTGNLRLQAHTHLNRAHTLTLQGHQRAALHHNQQALQLYRAAGDEPGEADALNSVGWTYGLLGDHELCLEHCRQALALFRRLGTPGRELNTLDTMGHALHHLGRLDEAIACFEEGLALTRGSGDRYNELDLLTHLGDTLHAAGRTTAACEQRRLALDLLSTIDRADALELRTRLTVSLDAG